MNPRGGVARTGQMPGDDERQDDDYLESGPTRGFRPPCLVRMASSAPLFHSLTSYADPAGSSLHRRGGIPHRISLRSGELTLLVAPATQGHHYYMGSYGGLYVGSIRVASIKNRVPPELLSVFTDSMYRSRIAEASEFYVDTDPGATVTAHEFTARGQVIADRLDILGFTPVSVYDALNRRLDQARHLCALPLWDGVDPEYVAKVEAEEAYLGGYTAQDWIADLRSTADSPDEDSKEPGSLHWLMFCVEDEDARLVLRALLLARPGDEVRMDVTDLVAEGWLDDCPVGICASGLSAMRTVAAVHAPIVVLTRFRE